MKRWLARIGWDKDGPLETVLTIFVYYGVLIAYGYLLARFLKFCSPSLGAMLP